VELTPGPSPATNPPPASRNVELKCRCADLSAAAVALRPLAAREAAVLRQVDTYFPVPHGRLKLREIATDGSPPLAQLIWYDRPDAARARGSDYRLTPVSHPAELRASLAAALGVRGEVRKVRRVLLWHNVRIHLDDVDRLGHFVEFEAVIGPGDTEAAGHERLAELCRRLAITPADHMTGSYVDLLGL
jgi:adenylate cyclase class 2